MVEFFKYIAVGYINDDMTTGILYFLEEKKLYIGQIKLQDV